MKVGELRELIEDLDDDVEVKLLTQPGYPMVFDTDQAFVVGTNAAEIEELEEQLDPENQPDLGDEEAMKSWHEDHDRLDELREEDDLEVLWIVEGGGQEYAPGYLSVKAGWK